jgi:hypothetical protein
MTTPLAAPARQQGAGRIARAARCAGRLDPDALTPREALERLYELKRLGQA